jgi:nucleotide-binding universal stress UspA family protein
MKLIKNALLVISGTQASVNAARYAIMLCKEMGINLYVLYVIDTATIKELMMSNIFIEEESKEYEKSLEMDGEKYLSMIEEMAKSKKLKITRLLRKGMISTEIISASRENRIDVIILGEWQESKSRRDLISMESRYVLANAEVSVLVVKEEDLERKFKKF